MGYVGLANALLLAKKHDVVGIDINEHRIKKLQSLISPLQDDDIIEELKITSAIFSTGDVSDLAKMDYAIISLPTNFVAETNSFDCDQIKELIFSLFKKNSDITFIIKSTVYVGFCESLCAIEPNLKVCFVPEFLREGSALQDALNPERVIIGGSVEKECLDVKDMFEVCYLAKPSASLSMSNSEAEACKLFANTYLAMRVGFFNEIDSFCMTNDLDSAKVISGISSDHRIGSHYNNPSFGYGGYCLPKDTLQARSNFVGIPESLISAIVSTNSCRKTFLIDFLCKLNLDTYGVFRLAMKKSSDNFREAAVLDIIAGLVSAGRKVVVYEPDATACADPRLHEVILENNLEKFKKSVEIIIANRMDGEIMDCSAKVFTRDIFNNN